MTGAGEAKILRLYEEALDLDNDALARWLDQLRAEDAAAAREVEALIAADEASGSRMATRIVWPRVSAESGALPEQIGPYRIERLLGEGGMGRVMLARRTAADFEQKVAIKLVRPQLARGDLAERFREERRILARLRHPNIAQLIDAGLTEEGQPYFVMEYVEGVPVTEWLAETTPLSGILRLFIRIGRAVQFAHGNLVIHRDIKPGNILVTEDGIPKLLDFGIARAVEGAAAEERSDRFSATPAYASPEQLSGKLLTTASDIWSLGALLFEMVTGETPFGGEEASPAELKRRVLEDDPPAASATGLGPARRAGRDLDATIAKAMHQLPGKRYATVSQFADDVERILERRPVSAREAGWRYLAGHFIRRHAWAAGASAAALAILVAALLVTSLLYRDAQRAQTHAEQRYGEVRELATTMLFDIYDQMAVSPGSTQARALLAETAQRYLEQLAADPDAPPDVWLETGRGYRRLGDLFANPAMSNLSRFADGREAYLRADEILSALARDRPGWDALRYERGMLALSRSQAVGHLDEDREGAMALARRAETLFAGIARGSPFYARAARARLGARIELGVGLIWGGGYEEAIALLERVDRSYARLIRAAGGEEALALGRRRTEALRNLGDARYYAGDIPGSVEAYRAAVPLYEAILAAEPRDTGGLATKVIIQWSLGGSLYDLDRLEESLAALETAAATSRLLRTLDPDDAHASRMARVVDAQRALTLAGLRRFDEAIAFSLAGLRVREAALRRNPGTPGPYRDLAAAYRPLGDIYLASGDRRRACAAYREADARWTEAARRWSLNEIDAGRERGAVAEGIAQAC